MGAWALCVVLWRPAFCSEPATSLGLFWAARFIPFDQAWSTTASAASWIRGLIAECNSAACLNAQGCLGGTAQSYVGAGHAGSARGGG